MTRRSTLTAIALASALSVAACGGEGAGGTDRPAASTGTSASPSPGTTDGTPSATTPREPVPPPASASGTADAAPRDTTRKSGEGRGADETELAVLTRVRVGVHGTYDRVVFDFEGGVPPYVVEYVDALHQDGSGEEIPIAGEHRMMLVFARAQPESPEKKFDAVDAGTPTVRGLELVSYFEGDTRFGIGVDTRRGDGRPGFRVTEVRDKIVVDIAHEAAG